MTDAAITAAAGVALLGSALAVAGAAQARRAGADDVGDYLRGLDQHEEAVDEYEARLQEPALRRLVAPLGTATADRLASFTPSGQLDRLHALILQAGLSGSIRAEELGAVQVLLATIGLVVGGLPALASAPSTGMATLMVLGPPISGFLGPRAWLDRKVRERKDAIRRDLPDVLDLLAIAVEAGTGFEGAVAVVVQDFATPLGIELSRTLKEMELGLSRREAMQNLKRRTEVPELSAFVLAIIQADALGMPIGRVLRTQAVEMRNRRRAWARERAGKLPVKILIPLVLFIFPTVMVVAVGPAASSLYRGLR
jgi:tight adherence protein C